MEFKETYRHEVYLSRKVRSQRALFAAKLTGFVLVLTVGATLRAEPELRRLLFNAGMNGVSSFANLEAPDVAVSALPAAPQSAERTSSDLPTSRVKVNRPARATPQPNTAAEQLAVTLSRIQPGG